jgi:hypothetical protein
VWNLGGGIFIVANSISKVAGFGERKMWIFGIVV